MFDVFYKVAGHRKKILAFLVTVALGGGALLFPAFAGKKRLQGAAPCSSAKQQSAQSATDRTESEDLKSKAGFLLANDPNFSIGPGNSLGGREFFFKIMLSVLLVVVLGVAAIYLSKKVLPKITNLPGKQIRIVETVHLGPRKAVHLLEIENRRFLIGSTNENITKLAEITSTLADLSSQEMENINDRQAY